MGVPHSERAGGAVLLATGEPAALYRALRELSCSRCCGLIREGELFTRQEEPGSGLPLVRLCRGCEPFSRAGGLLDALLAPRAGGESAPAPQAGATEEGEESGGARAAMMSRLGPALELSRRRR